MRSGLGHYERGQRAATQPFKNHWCPLSSPCPFPEEVTGKSQIPPMCRLPFVPCKRKFPLWMSNRWLPPRCLLAISLLRQPFSSSGSFFLPHVMRSRLSPNLLWRGLSLEGHAVDGILLNVLVEVLVTHKLLHTPLAQSVRIQNLEKFLELI